MRPLREALFICLGLWASLAAHAQALSGAGSTAAAPFYIAVDEQLGSKNLFSVNYNSVGSAEGLRRMLDRSVDFGASDKPMSRQELASNGLLQFPTAIGAVVITANLPGANVAQLKLDGAVLADIYLGTITRWNDARIAALNPELSLPRLAITVITREEGSGTAHLFGNYLGRVSTAWKENGKAGFAGATVAKGNNGVLQAVQSSPGAIGYLEYSYAQQNKLPTFQLKNSFGTFVSPSIETISAVVRAADWELMFMDANPSFEINTVNVGCPSCWPIAGMTYVVVPRRWTEAPKASSFMRFLEALLNDGDAVAKEKHYVPLPSRAKNLVKVTLRNQMQDAKGLRLRSSAGDLRSPRPQWASATASVGAFQL